MRELTGICRGFQATLFESVESVTGRRIDVGSAERCLREFGGVAGVGAMPNATAGGSNNTGHCGLDDVAPRVMAANGSSTEQGTAVLEHSVVEVLWELGDATPSGVYRLVGRP